VRSDPVTLVATDCAKPETHNMSALRTLTMSVARLALVACGSTHDAETKGKHVSAQDFFPVGSHATFSVSAHCGAEFTRIDGVTWRTKPRDGGAPYTAPERWPQMIRGTLTRPAEKRAVFTSDQIPETLVFRPAPNAVWSCM
jgi:hypothetical protein